MSEAFRAALQATALPLELGAGGPAGPGGAALLDLARVSDLMLVGEEHGVAEIPPLLGSLFAEGGFRRLALQLGPHSAANVEARLRHEGLDGLRALVRAHPGALPFYGWRPDAELLAQVVASRPDEPELLWGLDLEHVDSARLHLAELQAGGGGSGPATGTVAAALGERLANARGLHSSGIPDLYALAGAEGEALVEALGGPARDRIADAVASLEIYQHHRQVLAGHPEGGYRNQLERADWMRRQLRARLAGGPPPPTLFRFGERHMTRGLTADRVYGLAALAAEVAFLHELRIGAVLIVAGPGSVVRSLDGPTVPAGLGAARLGAAVSGLPSGPQLLDLRTVRAAVAVGRLAAPADVVPTLFAYDLAVVLQGSRPAAPLLPGPGPATRPPGR